MKKLNDTSDISDRFTEIERKFLIDVAGLPHDFETLRHVHVSQGYLGEGFRLRDAEGQLSLAVKSPGGLQRAKFEIPLTTEQFASLWHSIEGRLITKTSYYIDGEQRIELDIFEGQLAGLIIAEVEFDSLEAAHSFTPPSWFGREVTELPQYKNQNLAELVARMSTKPFMDVLGIELNSGTSDYLL